MPAMDSFWSDGERTLYLGDALEVLRGLPEGSVHCVVTSVPFWALRQYADVGGEQIQIWGGAEDCEHEWQSERVYTEKSAGRSSGEAFQKPGPENVERLKKARWREQTFCQLCGAWRGALGLEPDATMWVANLVSIFREVRRVLRDDGVCMVNCGDSYNAGTSAKRKPTKTAEHGYWENEEIAQRSNSPGLKPKDLIGQPFRLAVALQADGWWWRAMLPWVKPSSAMPESIRDRPAVSTEYWIMLAKSGRYFWDADGIRKQLRPKTLTHRGGGTCGRVGAQDELGKVASGNVSRMPRRVRSEQDTFGGASREGRGQHSKGGDPNKTSSGRTYRTGDMLLESLDAEIEAQKARLAHIESVRKNGGLLLDEAGDPVAVLQNPVPFKGTPYLGDWPRKEWRPAGDGQKKIEVWYIAHPDCKDHAHYHQADKWQKLGYASGREIEARAGDADPKAAKCPCVEVRVDHFAAFSVKLIEPLLKAGCPTQVCADCGAPWVREVKRTATNHKARADRQTATGGAISGGVGKNFADVERETLGFRPTCECDGGTEAGTVLDPFSGTGTTGVGCKEQGLRYVGIDVSRDYSVMASARIHETGKTKKVVEAERAGQEVMEL